MIVGNGDIASVLKEVDRKDYIFFASGVSNSQEKRKSEYKRELDLLLKQDKSKHLIYFSSLAIFYSDTPYTRHKRLMEKTISVLWDHYTIIRLGNITWGVNPHTIINFMKVKIVMGEKFPIRNVYRYVVSKEDFLHWINLIPDWNCEMNIPGERMSVKEIYAKINSHEL